MANLKRSVVIKLMEQMGFGTVSALSTGRLEKKVNRLDRVIEDRSKLQFEDDSLEEVLDYILKSIKTNTRIIVEDDRPNIPRAEEERVNKRSQRQETEGRQVRRFDGRKSQYDWGKILSGDIVVLEQGTDYTCKTATFALQVRAAAKRRGKQVKVATRQGQVVVQALTGKAKS